MDVAVHHHSRIIRQGKHKSEQSLILSRAHTASFFTTQAPITLCSLNYTSASNGHWQSPVGLYVARPAHQRPTSVSLPISRPTHSDLLRFPLKTIDASTGLETHVARSTQMYILAFSLHHQLALLQNHYSPASMNPISQTSTAKQATNHAQATTV